MKIFMFDENSIFSKDFILKKYKVLKFQIITWNFQIPKGILNNHLNETLIHIPWSSLADQTLKSATFKRLGYMTP